MAQPHTGPTLTVAMSASVPKGNWGVCDAMTLKGRSETWWAHDKSGWRALGPALAVGASAEKVQAQNYGIPDEVVEPLVIAVAAHRQVEERKYPLDKMRILRTAPVSAPTH